MSHEQKDPMEQQKAVVNKTDVELSESDLAEVNGGLQEATQMESFRKVGIKATRVGLDD